LLTVIELNICRFEPAQSNKELENLLKTLQDDEEDVQVAYAKNDSYQVPLSVY